MEIYLAIITTILVLTQIIRVTQNTMQLKKLGKTWEKEQAKEQRLEELWDMMYAACEKYLESEGK